MHQLLHWSTGPLAPTVLGREVCSLWGDAAQAQGASTMQHSPDSQLPAREGGSEDKSVRGACLDALPVAGRDDALLCAHVEHALVQGLHLERGPAQRLLQRDVLRKPAMRS